MCNVQIIIIIKWWKNQTVTKLKFVDGTKSSTKSSTMIINHIDRLSSFRIKKVPDENSVIMGTAYNLKVIEL